MTTKPEKPLSPSPANPYAGRPLEPVESIVVHTNITEEPLEPLLADAKGATMTRAMGALVVFDGIVRDHDHGQAVSALSYTSHPLATDAIATVARSVADEIPGIRIWAVHRVGPIPIGESALTVLVAAAHRGTAFTACERLADRIKAEVPIWKEQELTSGAVQWVGIDTPAQ
ncbi:molybdenum cofactor biosynthesis protein MoaE [Rothia nasimurium]|uniref:molybdenum cofactor biosynthesis protein MoaE n=1 Tax=Rothia nasimurium TaxID=85336 RepID=UPI001F182BDD|nr:molybdenum cofactor biosynthesis protein MoaE [Rothia nasimurium]